MFRISELTDAEIEAAKMLHELYQKLAALNGPSRRKVYGRWEMLHLIPAGDGKRWESELQRVATEH